MNLDTSPGPSLLANRDEIPEPTHVNSLISAAATSIINEEKEKDKRKLNIIVYITFLSLMSLILNLEILKYYKIYINYWQIFRNISNHFSSNMDWEKER